VVAEFGVFNSGAQSLTAPVANEDLTNKIYVDTQVGTVATDVTALQTALAGEALLRAALETNLTSALTAETTARQAADATLTTDLAAEVTARQAADATLTTDLATETAARIAATAGTALINAINDVATTGTIDAAHLPTTVVYNDINNTFTSTTAGSVIEIDANNNTLSGSAIFATSQRADATIQVENTYASATAGDGMAGVFAVGNGVATVANALYAHNYSNGNAFVAQAEGTGYAIAIPDGGGRVKLSADEGDGPVPANVSIYRFTNAAGTFTIAGGELGQIVYIINAIGGAILVYTNNIADGATAAFVYKGTTWVIL
jgi:hypothetical protein